MEPMNATVDPDSLEVWVGSQAPGIARSFAALGLGVEAEEITVHNQFLGGGFGRRAMPDHVLEAAQVAAAVGREAGGRLVPGVLGNEDSLADESFSDGLLEYPHYTRPADYRGWVVPDVLRSGDHGLVERWRRAWSLRRTIDVRPDLIAARGGLSDDDRRLLEHFDLDRDEDRAH